MRQGVPSLGQGENAAGVGGGAGGGAGGLGGAPASGTAAPLVPDGPGPVPPAMPTGPTGVSLPPDVPPMADGGVMATGRVAGGTLPLPIGIAAGGTGVAGVAGSRCVCGLPAAGVSVALLPSPQAAPTTVRTESEAARSQREVCMSLTQ